MANLELFRERVYTLYRSANPFKDNRRPTQQDLAEAVGLNRSELSNRLNGTKNARLTPRDVRAIVIALADWGALQTTGQVTELLNLAGCQPFSPADWQAPPLCDLLETKPTTSLSARSESEPAVTTKNQLRPRLLPSFRPLSGRSRELREVKELVLKHRLVTLWGAGGIGKTHLALAAAQDLRAAFGEAVWFVQLEEETTAGNLAAFCANNLGLTLTEPSVAALGQVLTDTPALLVLDTCEHLLAAVSLFARQLLALCPRLHLLVTSRERLGNELETVYPLVGLNCPMANQAFTADASEEIGYSAVSFFVEQVRLGVPSFQLTAKNAGVVGEICRRLDGSPLALQLAARRLTVLSPDQLLTRLDRRFGLLSAPAHATARPRHQSLQICFDWSYRLLDEQEQWLLKCLSVFEGSFPLEAIESICARALPDSPDQLDLIFELTARLLDKSWLLGEEIYQEDSTAIYYRLSENARLYCFQHLDETTYLQLRPHNRGSEVFSKIWKTLPIGLAERRSQPLAAGSLAWFTTALQEQSQSA